MCCALPHTFHSPSLTFLPSRTILSNLSRSSSSRLYRNLLLPVPVPSPVPRAFYRFFHVCECLWQGSADQGPVLLHTPIFRFFSFFTPRNPSTPTLPLIVFMLQLVNAFFCAPFLLCFCPLFLRVNVSAAKTPQPPPSVTRYIF